MKPPFTLVHDEKANVIYVTGADNRPASAIDHGGYIARFADDNGELVGITIYEPELRKLE